MNQLAQRAVQAAIRGNWQEAAQINEDVLRESPNDKDALNRLAHAYVELGKRQQALLTYKKVIKLDPYNTIAKKAVDRLQKLKGSASRGRPRLRPLPNGQSAVKSATVFLEEPGKTRTVSLIHLGSSTALSSLDIAYEVKLVPHAHRVSVEIGSGQYIGRLPDDISRRIIKFSREGNEYEAFVRSVNQDSVRIFIRETKRGVSIADIPSFPLTEKPNYVAFTPPDLIHDERPEVESLEEESE
ncbi:MAG: tetratricopeptide repeat protein [Candidatus Blackburnbacteria bacterium]|nr:tetratricopeptide repeat protein [Candidatus Blackburnbacteria bacterium]